MHRNFGLIGYPLTHSFSPEYFNDKFNKEGIDAYYGLYPLTNIDKWPSLIEKNSFSGINVTIPYKKTIIPYLDALEEKAKKIGSVNTIRFENGKTIGYNTDAYGFEKSLLQLINSHRNVELALVLGSGGAAAAVTFVLKSLNIPFLSVSRFSTSGDVTYDNLPDDFFNKKGLIINTTPLGMHPDIESAPQLPYSLLTKNIYMYDLVYNPKMTTFLQLGKNHGCTIKNGHDMLIYQAEKAWEIWNN